MNEERPAAGGEGTGRALKVSRRTFLQDGSAMLGTAMVGTAIVGTEGAAAEERASAANAGTNPGAGAGSSFVELIRQPDLVRVFPAFAKTVPADEVKVTRSQERWSGKGVEVSCSVHEEALVLALSAPGLRVAAVHVRWQAGVDRSLKVLGDAWERSYGDLGWRGLSPERVLPWYFATHDGRTCHGYGVKTDARALCFWQVDAEGVSLWLNVANGGDGVELGQRQLQMATVVALRGEAGGDPLGTVTALCRGLRARASRPLQPIYGINDWCYSYGRSTAKSILLDTKFLTEVAPGGEVRPFSVVDEGWKNGSAAWPDMGELAAGIKKEKVRPGIWIRPLEAPKETAGALLMPGARFGEKRERARELAYDPTHPEAQERIRAKVKEAVQWGYEMVKHDFSTYDLLGQWGFEMGPQPSMPGWWLHDRSRTNAEVMADLYAMLREAAGQDVLLDGCNTVGHLGQGVFDLQRTGDDTSGHQWERTRRMGVNTAAFRLPQHGTFFCIDPDLVGMTEAIPWEFNRQWLDLLARSGVATMVSPGPPSRGTVERKALREAFAMAAKGGAGAAPSDWLETTSPEMWEAKGLKGEEAMRTYDWSGAAGVSAFLAP